MIIKMIEIDIWRQVCRVLLNTDTYYFKTHGILRIALLNFPLGIAEESTKCTADSKVQLRGQHSSSFPQLEESTPR